MVAIDSPPQTNEAWIALVGSMNTELEELKTRLQQADAVFGSMNKENAELKAHVGAMKAKLQQAETSFGDVSAKLAEGKKTIKMLEGKLKSERQYDRRSILENTAVQGIESLSESKGYRMWIRKFKNVLEQRRRVGRKILLWRDTVTEKAVNDEFDATHAPADAKVQTIYGLWKDYVGTHEDNKVTKEEFDEMNKDIWAILVDQTKGEALNKVNGAGDGEGKWGYIRVH